MKLFVYHTPELTPTDKVPDCAIAIDVLRATTTMATALHAGAEAVQVFSDLDKLMHVSEQWPPEKRLRAGERGGGEPHPRRCAHRWALHRARRPRGRHRRSRALVANST